MRTPAPIDFDRQVLRRAGGERVQGVGSREVAATEHDLFLLYRDRASEHADLGACPGGVRRAPPQPHGHARGARQVPKHGGRRAQAVDDHVQCAVAVQVRRRHAVGDRILGGKAPPRAGVREREVAVIAKGDVLGGELGKQRQLAPPVERRKRRSHALPRVRVHHVPQMAGGG